jgi:hypothetical protein
LQSLAALGQNSPFVAIDFLDSAGSKSVLGGVSGFQLPYPLQDRSASGVDALHVKIALGDRSRVLTAPKIIAEPGKNTCKTLDILQGSRVTIDSGRQTMT